MPPAAAVPAAASVPSAQRRHRQHDQQQQQQHDGGGGAARRRLRALPEFARELIAGGVAGGVAKSCVAPLERAKIIMQTHTGRQAVGGVLRRVFEKEGLAGGWRGNGASLLRIVPYASVHFGAYEYARRLLVRLGGATAAAAAAPLRLLLPRRAEHPAYDLLAGSASGALAVLVTYPLDLARTRLAWATEAPAAIAATGPAAAAGGGPGAAAAAAAAARSSRPPGIVRLLRATAEAEGLRGLYRGAAPTLCGILPYSGCKFYVFNALKLEYRRLRWPQQQQGQEKQQQAQQQGQGQGQQQQGQQQKLPLPATLVIGGVAGLIAQTLTFPLDVIRRQMQVQGVARAAAAAGERGVVASGSPAAAAATEARLTMAGIAKRLVHEGGWRALFRGLQVNFIKVVPSTSIGFTVYDHLRAELGLSTAP